MNNEMLLKGLKSTDVEILRAQFGFNDSYVNKPSIFVSFYKQVFHLINLIILVFIGIMFYFKFATFGAIILSIFIIYTILNTILRFIISNLLYSKLKTVSYQTSVIRDGMLLRIPSKELVPQDIILLTNGDITPADVSIIKTQGLEVNEYFINLQDQINTRVELSIIPCYTIITKGLAYAQVNNIGKEIQNKEHSPFASHEIKTNFNLAYNILRYKILSRVTNTNTILKSEKVINKLKKINLLTLDNLEILTKNNSHIENVIVNNPKLYSYILKVPNDNFNNVIDSKIIDYAAKFASIRTVLNTGNYVDNIVFDNNTRLSGYKFQNGILWFGSPKDILNKLVADELFKLDINSAIELEESNGLKAIGIGWSDSNDYSRSYLGTFLLKDEIKDDTTDVVNKLKNNDVKIKLISNDSLFVCTNIAINANIISSKELCINASELNFKNEEVLIEQVKFYSVFGRTNSKQKNAIIKALSKTYNLAHLDSVSNSFNIHDSVSVIIALNSSSNATKAGADIIITQPELSLIKDSIVKVKK
jgi:E1-E2 ATPase/Cation transporter/ATPase, N-terminus